MAIPKKGTRKIIVDNIVYRWLIRRKATYGQADYGNGKIHVAIELEQNPGTTLFIITDRGHPKDYNTITVVPVTPSDISNWIKQALALDWKPETKDSQFSGFIEKGKLIRSN